MLKYLLAIFVVILLAGCQTTPKCVVTPNDTVECS